MSAQSFVRQMQSLQQQAPPALDDRFEPIQGPIDQPDGSRLYTTAIIPVPGDDLTIPLGSWTLRLIGDDSAGQARIPITATFEAGADGAFRDLRVSLLRFELEADPRDLVPANLVIDPYTHLEPTSGVVKLIGPGLTLILAGEALDQWDVDFTGANGGSDVRFPSARFSPPHFLVGPSNNLIGVACDEVLLDLRSDITPASIEAPLGGNADPGFRGLLLQELGIFIGDPKETGTWSGMARVRDFVIRFDPVELTGTFEGELVHAVAPDDPQVAVEVTFVTDSGQRVSVEEVDPTIPAPIAPVTTRRVRLVAQPNWASAGFQVTWTVPEAAQLEDPTRVNNPDLGWVAVPPGAHAFTVDVTDHRVDPVSATRTVLVQAPTAEPGTPPLLLILRAAVEEPTGGSNAVHLHLPLRRQQPLTLTLSTSGGAGDQLSAVLGLPAGFSVAGGTARQATRTAGGGFADLVWQVTAADSIGEGALTVLVTLGDATEARRLRYTLRDTDTPGEPALDLLTYTDWLQQDGIGAALAFAHDGLPYDAIEWRLASIPAPSGLFSDPTHDALFVDGAAELVDTTLALATTGGLVKPALAGPDRLYRLSGVVPPGVASRPASLVVGPPGFLGSAPLAVSEVVALFNEAGEHAAYRPGNAEAAAIQFAYNRFEVPPASVNTGQGDPTLATLQATQAQGFADLFRAILDHGTRLERIGLFASASTEGTDEHNQELSENRLAAVTAALTSPSPALRTAIAALPSPHRLTDTEITTASNLFAVTPRSALAWGELNATGTAAPFDRRVFAVLRFNEVAAPAGLAQRAYFLVRSDAPPAPTPTPARLPKPEQHPFRHSVFRSAHVEIELLRNELVRLQIRLELDVERFDENDLDPAGSLNPGDGVVTGFLELRRNPDPAATPRFRWELDLLSDPTDVDGLAAFVLSGTGTNVVSALGGPAIALPAIASASGGRTGPGGLIAALALGVFFQQIGFLDVRQMIWRGLRLKLQHGGAAPSHFSVGLDYTVRYNIDADLAQFGIPVRLQTSQPIEIAFRNVGVEVIGLSSVELFYDPASGFALDVADPGVFQLGDGLGRLLRVDRVTIGSGSPLWLEVELAFALDLGIFTVEALRLRVSLESDHLFAPDANGEVHLDASAFTLDDLRITLNKLAVGVDVPGVIEGHGALGIRDDGAGGTTIEGSLALGFPSLPYLREVTGDLRIFERDDLRALYLALGAEFRPGIPLGSLGVAIYGLHGLLGVNMARSIADPLAWLKANPVGVTDPGKWMPERGGWTFGVGATIGTVYDEGFSFHLKGTLLLELPGPRFVLATQAELFTGLPTPEQPPAGLLATAMLDLENDLLTVGVQYSLDLAGLLEINVPAEAFFDLAHPRNFHLRLGQWEPEERRASVRVFDLFDAWGYLQIEGQGLHNGALNLEGICVGAGARIEIEWGTPGLLYLEAFAEAHAGLQFKPLYFEGLVRVGGELHVGPISIGARGELTAKVRVSAPSFVTLRGEVCGHIDLWFTEIEKCVDFELGDDDQPTPDPDNPFVEAVAIDRMTGQAIAEENGVVTMPIDGLFHLSFGADITEGRSPAGASLVTDPDLLLNQVSSELFYRFRLDNLALRPVGGAPLSGVQSAWAPYSLISGDAGDANSQRTLRVLDWMPTAHPRQLDYGTVTESVLSVLISQLCNGVEKPQRVCADFDEEPLGPRARWLLDAPGLRPVQVIAGPGAGLGAEAHAAATGLEPAHVVPLVPAEYRGRRPQRHCLDLGHVQKVQGGGLGRILAGLPLTAASEELEAAVKHNQTVLDLAIEGRALPPELAGIASLGTLVVRLPGLTALDVTLVTPRAFRGDAGEALLLDAWLSPLLGPLPLGTLPPVAGATTSGPIASHVVRRLSWEHPDPDTLLKPGEAGGGATWLLLRPPGQPSVEGSRETDSFLLEICGITLASWRRFREHAENVAQTISILQGLTGLVAGQPAVSSQPMLEPGREYELVGSLSWKRFRARDDDSDDGTGGPLAVQSRRFRASPTAPREISAYVRGHDPIDEAEPHYTGEPIVLEFASDVIDRLFAAYGRQLVLRAKADRSGHVAVQPMSAIAGHDFVPIGPAQTAIFEALTALTGACLPGDWRLLFPQGRAVLTEPLSANTGYTIALLPRPQAEPGLLDFAAWDRVLQAAFDNGEAVYRFDIRTSRYPDFTSHVAAYAAAPVGDLFIDDPAAFENVLSGLSPPVPVRSDAVVDALCVAVGGGPIAIPAAPEVFRLWVPDGSGWRCRALLLDGPEPLLRHRRTAGGDAVEPRISLDVRLTAGPAVPFDQGTPGSSLKIAAGARGARVFVCFAAPGGTTTPGAMRLRLTDLGTSRVAGSAVDFPVTLGAVPGVLQDEG